MKTLFLFTLIVGDQIRIPSHDPGGATRITSQQALKIQPNQLQPNIRRIQDGTGVIVYPEPTFIPTPPKCRVIEELEIHETDNCRP